MMVTKHRRALLQLATILCAAACSVPAMAFPTDFDSGSGSNLESSSGSDDESSGSKKFYDDDDDADNDNGSPEQCTIVPYCSPGTACTNTKCDYSNTRCCPGGSDEPEPSISGTGDPDEWQNAPHCTDFIRASNPKCEYEVASEANGGGRTYTCKGDCFIGGEGANVLGGWDALKSVRVITTSEDDDLCSTDGRCGPEFGNKVCPGNACCSQFGWCGGKQGTSSAWCSDGQEGIEGGKYQDSVDRLVCKSYASAPAPDTELALDTETCYDPVDFEPAPCTMFTHAEATHDPMDHQIRVCFKVMTIIEWYQDYYNASSTDDDGMSAESEWLNYCWRPYALIGGSVIAFFVLLCCCCCCCCECCCCYCGEASGKDRGTSTSSNSSRSRYDPKRVARLEDIPSVPDMTWLNKSVRSQDARLAALETSVIEIQNQTATLIEQGLETSKAGIAAIDGKLAALGNDGQDTWVPGQDTGTANAVLDPPPFSAMKFGHTLETNQSVIPTLSSELDSASEDEEQAPSYATTWASIISTVVAESNSEV